MQNEPLDKLRDLGNRMISAWPDFAGDLARLPHAKDLSVRDLAVLMLLAPGEHVGRPAVEGLFENAGDADVAISYLTGHGLVNEDPDGVVLTNKGRELVNRLVEVRVQAAFRLLNTLPEASRDALLQGFEEMARAIPRAGALTKPTKLEPA